MGVHQGSVLSPILFAIFLEALSRGFSAGLPWELLYANDLVIMADSLDELCEAGKIIGGYGVRILRRKILEMLTLRR